MPESRIAALALRAVAAVCCASVVAGSAALALTTPGYTRWLVTRVDAATVAGVDEASALEAAEQVRGYVAGHDAGPLPASVAGRAGFDPAAVSHLADVRAVMRGARVAVGVSAGVLALWVLLVLSRRRPDDIAAGLRWGAALTAGVVLMSGVSALLDFESFFVRFHGLFFEPGTWVFPSDSLLIQLFPEDFWRTTGAAWGILCLTGAGLLWVASRPLAARPTVRRS